MCHILFQRFLCALKCVKLLVQFFMLSDKHLILEAEMEGKMQYRRHLAVGSNGNNICLLCPHKIGTEGRIMQSINKHNYRVHFMRMHAEKAFEYGMIDPKKTHKKIKKDIIDIPMSRNEYIKSCVQIATVTPFTFFENPGWQRLTRPIEEKLNLKIHRRNIPNYIELVGNDFHQILLKEIGESLVSIKFDVATRKGRAILGINSQMIKNGKICVRTLNMIELKRSHTGLYVSTKIAECLNRFNINIDQIYTCTTDSGKNMLKAVEIMKNCQSDETVKKLYETFLENDGYNEEDEQHFFKIIRIAAKRICEKSKFTLQSVACAAHTCQLGVKDAIKALDIEENLDSIRDIIKKLRTEPIKTELKNRKLRLPFLDIATRWDSTYISLEYLAKIKETVNILSSIYDLEFTEELWDIISNFLEAFKPIHHLTLSLQLEQLTMGDMYKEWLKCKLFLAKIRGPFGAAVLDKMENRMKKIISITALLSAMFLDPRYNYIGSSHFTIEQKAQAKVGYIKFEQIYKVENIIKNILRSKIGCVI